MKSEDKQLETQMASPLFGNTEPTNIQQDVREMAARSWLWRTGRRCKEYLLQSTFCCICMMLVFVLMVAIIACVLGFKHKISHEGKFPHEQCPSEWIGYKRKCYFISEEEKNWTSSQTFCAAKESTLVVFENPEEMFSLVKHLKIDDSWIGLRKKGEDFYWENGVRLKVDLFHIRNHSECAYLDTSSISTSACSLPRRCICLQLPKAMT